jgi:SAM-dependent methyltransferase
MEGELRCGPCDRAYPITGGVPRFAGTQDGPTAESFGFEWNRWPNFGWEPDELEAESRVFAHKTLNAEFDGNTFLEAGCGNGRYLFQAQKRGARVVGLDLSIAVDAAFANTREMENVSVVQGDIFKPPFRRGVFDGMYSIGVLMHTGDAERAFASLVPVVKPGGTAVIHLYKRGSAVYEWVDATIRKRTTRWDRDRLLLWSERVGKLVAPLPPRLRYWLNAIVRVHPHPSVNFDWYATTVATHHTYPEVRGWFERLGLEVVADNDKPRAGWKRRLYPELSMTVRGVAP